MRAGADPGPAGESGIDTGPPGVVKETNTAVGQDAGTPTGVLCIFEADRGGSVSKCHLCGIADAQAILVKCQWFGRGTKWLCVECVRRGSARPAAPIPAARPRAARAARVRTGGLDLPGVPGRNFP